MDGVGVRLKVTIWAQNVNVMRCVQNVRKERMAWTVINRVKSFFQKHGRLLSFVGALIVFTTFIVKDAIREHLKDLVDAVNSAEEAYRNETSIALVSKQIVDLELQLDSFEKAMQFHRSAVTERTMANRDAATTTKFMLENLETLNNTLPTGATFRGRINDHKTILQKLEEGLLELDRRSQATGLYEKRTTGEEDTAKRLNNGVWAEYWLFVIPMGDKVLAEANEAKKRREIYYKACTAASYMLYALGWSLGLAGRLFSVEGLVSGGD